MAHSPLSDAEKLAWLRLSRTENVGPITFYRLLQRYGTAINALDALPDLARRGGRTKPLVAYDKSRAEDEMARLDKIGAKLIVQGESDYPHLLKQVEDAPPVITVLGNPDILSQNALAVVGARNASLTGRKMAENLSRACAAEGFVITSGLARGIDTAAHTSALQTGTVAVVAGGIDVIYPRENEQLYKQIAEQGAIVAESPLGTQPVARHFPRRNRIISGLCLGTLIVEAAEKSGSLITARMALEQNREVFAIPGSPMDPRAGGTNRLLKDNSAHLVTGAEDILNVLRSLRLQPLFEPEPPQFDLPLPQSQPAADQEKRLDALREKILELLSYTPIAVDEIVRECESSIAEVLTVLLELELAGRIERQPGNRVNLI